MLGWIFSSKLDWGFYIISIGNTASRKIGALFRSMTFLSPEVALYLYKSTTCPRMEYSCHVWAGTPSCYLKLLYKLQKRICRAVGPSLFTFLESLAHQQMQPAEVFSKGITLVDVHPNWVNWFHSLFLEGGLLVILIDSMRFFCQHSLDVTRMSMLTVSFLALVDSGILCLQNAFL